MKNPQFIRSIRYLMVLICIIFIQNTFASAISPVKQSNSSPRDQHLFSKFWSGFRKAVLAGNSSAVAGMVLYPFTDQYQEIYFKAYGGKTPLSASSRAGFLTKLSQNFCHICYRRHQEQPLSVAGQQ